MSQDHATALQPEQQSETPSQKKSIVQSRMRGKEVIIWNIGILESHLKILFNNSSSPKKLKINIYVSCFWMKGELHARLFCLDGSYNLKSFPSTMRPRKPFFLYPAVICVITTYILY